MKKFSVLFASGDRFAGSAKQIVADLKNSSKFEYMLTPRAYMRKFSFRHFRAHGTALPTWSYQAFVRSLAKSPIIESVTEIKE